MNLHAIVRGAITAINPDVLCTVRRSTGVSATSASGVQTPGYADIPDVPVQVQALSYSDLMKLDALNIQGVRRAIYLNGAVMGLVRVAQRGGDLIVFPSGTLPEGDVWLAALNLEQWPDWCKVAITLQNGS
jgi:hypothetical protein